MIEFECEAFSGSPIAMQHFPLQKARRPLPASVR
jgi:hypothetical protein